MRLGFSFKKPVYTLGSLALLSFAQPALADQAQDMLIDKLNKVHLTLSAQDPSKVPVTLRLADLYAERARKSAAEELGRGCTQCTAGREDRLKAMALYDQVIDQLPKENQGKIRVQMGHLQQLLGNEGKASALYQKVIQEQSSPASVSSAYLALGEMAFKQRKFNEAIQLYSEVLKKENTDGQGLAAYRKAWSQFNLERTEEAIQGLRTVLNTPSLLTRNSGGVVNVDSQFQEEVSHDLVTFLARRGKVTVADAEEIYKLSPERTKQTNLTYLAKELERLGQQESAIPIWRFALSRETDPKNRMEGHIFLTDMEKGRGQVDQSRKDFREAVQIWPQVADCQKPEACLDLKQRLRKYVLDWNRVEKEKPSAELFESYNDYLKLFPNEKDMMVWAAQVATQQKKYSEALSLYKRAQNAVEQELNTSAGVTAKDKKALEKEFDGILLSQVEVAELSKDKNAEVLAYDEYLKNSKLKEKLIEVRYQKAHMLYEAQDYASASLALRELALSSGGDSKVKTQAADLALDSLVLLKDDEKLEQWSEEFAKALPAKAAEYRRIGRTSQMNQVAKLAGTSSDKAWEKLTQVNQEGMEPEQKISYLKDKIVLAEKMGKLPEARVAVDQLLSQKSLRPEDRQFALNKKSWFSELILDFKTALEATKEINSPELKGDQKQLRLALFAELSEQDPAPYYRELLKTSQDPEQKAMVAAKLVRLSKKPMEELKAQSRNLSSSKSIYSNLVLELFAQKPSVQVADALLSDKGVKGLPAEMVLQRYKILDESEKIQGNLSGHKIRTENQKTLTKDLKERIALLDQLEGTTKKAIASTDWTSQLVTLDLLGKESERFYQDLMGLPLPEGLNDQEQQEYMGMLAQQAGPYQVKAQELKAKTQEFWTNQSALDKLKEEALRAEGQLRTLALDEVKTISKISPPEVKPKIEAILSAPPSQKSVPPVAQIEGARQLVRENPMGIEPLNQLIQVEKQMGREEMVQYLEARLKIVEDKNKTNTVKENGVVR